MVEHKAHRQGMRIRHICAWGTSRLAFDGSGRVLRGREAGFCSYSLCQFPNGKVYNCDLNASYNIGARYWLRTIKNKLTEEQISELVEKVPTFSKATTWTLDTLKKVLPLSLDIFHSAVVGCTQQQDAG